MDMRWDSDSSMESCTRGPQGLPIKAVVFDFPKTILDAHHAYEGGWTDFQAVFPQYLGVPFDRLVDVHDTAAVEAWYSEVEAAPASTGLQALRSRYDHHKWSTICRRLGFMRCQIPDKIGAMKSQIIHKTAMERHCREVHQSTIAVDELLKEKVEVGFFTIGILFEHQPSAPWKLGFVAFKKTRHEVAKPGDHDREKMAHLRKAAGIQPAQPVGSASANAQGNEARTFNDPSETVFIGVRGTREMRLARQAGMQVLYWDPSRKESISYRLDDNDRKWPYACSNMISVPIAVRELSSYLAGN